MSAIKNIIFDLGGVLLNIDYSKTEKAFQSLGIEKFEAVYSQAQQSKIFDLYETGKIDERTFLGELKKFVSENVSEKQIKEAWNSMLLDFPGERITLLKEAKKNYRTFLLSNTNETHINAFEQIVKDQHGISSLDVLFKKVYYSNRIGQRKPNSEIFEYVLSENGLDKSETVFFDDSIQHIKGAESIGLRSIFVERPKVITDFFDSSYKLIL